ncbi:MAG TPA: carboxypeptidase-like regulatory domain-containing protein [Acidobacteriaceae bacterium]|nr:carboxypeptidase-like regulatory domain-containing protein [Acidobacteriaceae bacterium]
MRMVQSPCILMICMLVVTAAAGQQISAPTPQTAAITGTVTDVNDAIIPRAAVVLNGPVPSDPRTIMANDKGFFQFSNLDPGRPYRVTVSARGFADWTSPAVILKPGQFLDLTNIRLQVATSMTTVTAISAEQLATEQVKVEEKQRVFGVIPNFYVTYGPNAVPLTTKLKFHLALRALVDPVTFIGFGLNAAFYQAAGFPDYVQGAKGYGQRLGATFAGGYTNIMVGDAILPSLLHQDPRYFYQGTGTKKSRVLHAISSPFITRGDDGRREINYSNIGGDLASGAISNAYYPETNRGAELLLKSTLIGAGGRMANALLQEFVLRKYTSHAKNRP